MLESKNMRILLTALMTLLLTTLVFSQVKPVEISKKNALKVGEIAPDFSLKDQNGTIVKLSKVAKKSPVILVFYRGFW
jgi:cytochrome oxidase Cu insertion factor (SCO1/SenC/PrrC family)